MAPNQCKGASRYQPTEIHTAGLAVFLCLSLSLAADSKVQKCTLIVSRLLTKKTHKQESRDVNSVIFFNFLALGLGILELWCEFRRLVSNANQRMGIFRPVKWQKSCPWHVCIFTWKTVVYIWKKGILVQERYLRAALICFWVALYRIFPSPRTA